MLRRLFALLAVVAPSSGARLTSIPPVNTAVKDGGGTVHISIGPVRPLDSGAGVLHLRMVGGRISRRAATRSIRATSASIHACKTCTVVVDMADCHGVSPLAVPTTANFLRMHPELKQILIIEPSGAVLLACRTVRRLSGHDKLDLFRSWPAFEAACSGAQAAPERKAALRVASALRRRRTQAGPALLGAPGELVRAWLGPGGGQARAK